MPKDQGPFSKQREKNMNMPKGGKTGMKKKWKY
jgi:hypothetical protein